jgi:hypothetical protein
LPFCVAIPQDALGCYLFSWQGNVVAIDMLGAGIPILASLFIILYLMLRGRGKASSRRIIVSLLFVLVIGAVVALPYILAWEFYHSLGLSKWVNIPLVFALAIIQVAIVDKPKEVMFPLTTYVYWTFGAILSDLIRILSGTLNVTPLIIGASGIDDLIFDMGFIMMLACVFFSVFYVYRTTLSWGRSDLSPISAHSTRKLILDR